MRVALCRHLELEHHEMQRKQGKEAGVEAMVVTAILVMVFRATR